MSIISTATTLILLKNTNLGIYAVAGVSSIVWSIKVFFFNTINAAKNLRVKWYTFYPQYLKNLVAFIIVLSIYSILKKYFIMNSWGKLLIITLILAIVGYILIFLLLFNKKEKKYILKFIRK